MERNWKLGDDLSTHDSLLDGLTLDDIILALHHESVVNHETAKKCLKEMLESRLEDMWFIFENNVDEIIKEASKGRNSV